MSPSLNFEIISEENRDFIFGNYMIIVGESSFFLQI